MGKKSCVWVLGIQQGIKRARVMEGGQDRADECLEMAELVP
jgi:hypothetical protein